MAFDLPNAVPPELLPLQGSWEPGDYRDAVKRLTLDLFAEHLGGAAFDANVLGMAHLGSFDLVRRFVQADGLGMLRSDREAPSTRYLYRAWKRADAQGRGLHFLRTYLQLLYPNEWEVAQLEQHKNAEYPLVTRPAGLAGVDPSTHYLTSRVSILIDANANNAPLLSAFVPTISSVLPARFVPDFGVFRASTLPTYCGAALASLGHSLAKPVLSKRVDAGIDIGAGLFGAIQSGMLPRVMRGSLQSRAAIFGTNVFRRPTCPAVRIVSAARCLERASLDPEIPEWQQTLVKVAGRGMRGGLGVVVTDKRTPTLGTWPMGLPALPERVVDGYGIGGAVIGRVGDSVAPPTPLQGGA